MENKVHFKLHKVKKQWVTIAVSGLALGASLIGVGVSADEQATNQATSSSTPESVTKIPILSSQRQLQLRLNLKTQQLLNQAIQIPLSRLTNSQSLKKTKQVVLTICPVAKRELLLQLQKSLAQLLT